MPIVCDVCGGSGGHTDPAISCRRCGGKGSLPREMVACPRCNGGVGFHKFGFDNLKQPCDLCHDTGSVSEPDAADWIDGQRG